MATYFVDNFNGTSNWNAHTPDSGGTTWSGIVGVASWGAVAGGVLTAYDPGASDGSQVGGSTTLTSRPADIALIANKNLRTTINLRSGPYQASSYGVWFEYRDEFGSGYWTMSIGYTAGVCHLLLNTNAGGFGGSDTVITLPVNTDMTLVVEMQLLTPDGFGGWYGEFRATINGVTYTASCSVWNVIGAFNMTLGRGWKIYDITMQDGLAGPTVFVPWWKNYRLTTES